MRRSGFSQDPGVASELRGRHALSRIGMQEIPHHRDRRRTKTFGAIVEDVGIEIFVDFLAATHRVFVAVVYGTRFGGVVV